MHAHNLLFLPAEIVKEESSLISPELELIVLTWVTFIILFTILKKFAWGPILNAVSQRENTIRQSLDEAHKTHEEYLKIGDKRKQILMEADQSARDMLQQSRQQANKLAQIIEERAKNDAQIMMDNAKHEIQADQQRVMSQLKEESAHLAVKLAAQILQDSLDPDKHKKLNDSMIDTL